MGWLAAIPYQIKTSQSRRDFNLDFYNNQYNIYPIFFWMILTTTLLNILG